MEEAATPPRLWWAWVQQAFYLLAFVDGIALYGLWLIESSYNGLRLGYWFGWQIIWWALMLPPYVQSHVGTYARPTPFHQTPFLTDNTITWQRLRHKLHFWLSFPVLGVNLAFFIMLTVWFFTRCDTGSECDLNTTAWVMSAVIALTKAALAGIVILLVFKSPILSAVTLLRPPSNIMV